MSPRVLTFVAAFLALAPRAADACSVPFGFVETAPRDGSRLPQNGVWFVTGFDVYPVSATWLDVDVFLPLRVEKQLDVYEIHNDFSGYFGREADVSVESGRDDVESLRREFRIVAFEDRTAPEVTRPTDLSAIYQVSNPAGCTTEGWHVTLTVDRIADDFGLGAFYLLKETSVGPNPVAARLAEPGAVAERVLFTVNADVRDGGEACFRVRAVDLAGNRTDSDPACIVVGEDPSVMDAGVVDAGASVAPSRVRTGPEGLDLSGRGCACEAERRTRGSPFGFAFFVLCACVRRRPHPR